MATGEYVTHQQLAVVLEGLATKEDLERFATKEDGSSRTDWIVLTYGGWRTSLMPSSRAMRLSETTY